MIFCVKFMKRILEIVYTKNVEDTLFKFIKKLVDDNLKLECQ